MPLKYKSKLLAWCKKVLSASWKTHTILRINICMCAAQTHCAPLFEFRKNYIDFLYHRNNCHVVDNCHRNNCPKFGNCSVMSWMDRRIPPRKSVGNRIIFPFPETDSTTGSENSILLIEFRLLYPKWWRLSSPGEDLCGILSNVFILLHVSMQLIG